MRSTVSVAAGALSLALMLSPGPAAADFAAGAAAYDTGNYVVALREWLPLAEAGDVAAMRNVGHLYRLGRGTVPDPQRAAQWYRRAAERGFDRAMVNLAALYLAGQGVTQSDREAAIWLARAADAGNDVAAFNLAMLYELGRGVPLDAAAAQRWYEVSAAKGNAAAADRLAQLNRQVAAVTPMPATSAPAPSPPPAAPPPPAPPPVAAAPPQPAAAEPPPPPPVAEAAPAPVPPRQESGGDIFTSLWRSLTGPATPTAPAAPPPPAQVAAAPPQPAPAASGDSPEVAAGRTAYDRGEMAKALELWLGPARAGDTRAQYLVGKLYVRGDGVVADRLTAATWWTVAAQRGDGQARAALEAEFNPPLSAAERAEAEQRAASFRPATG